MVCTAVRLAGSLTLPPDNQSSTNTFTHPCPLTPNRLSGIVTFFTKPRLCPLRGSTGLKKSVPEMVAKSGRSALSGCIHVLG